MNHRVFRGGGWLFQPSFARMAVCLQNAPVSRGDNLGVRLVRLVNSLQQLAEVKDGE